MTIDELFKIKATCEVLKKAIPTSSMDNRVDDSMYALEFKVYEKYPFMDEVIRTELVQFNNLCIEKFKDLISRAEQRYEQAKKDYVNGSLTNDRE